MRRPNSAGLSSLPRSSRIFSRARSVTVTIGSVSVSVSDIADQATGVSLGSPIDVDALAVHVAGPVGHQPAHDVSDVFGKADPPVIGGGIELVDVLTPRLHEAAAHLGLHQTGGDDVDVDALTPLF